MEAAALCGHGQERDTLDWTRDAGGGVEGELRVPAVGALRGR